MAILRESPSLSKRPHVSEVPIYLQAMMLFRIEVLVEHVSVMAQTGDL